MSRTRSRGDRNARWDREGAAVKRMFRRQFRARCKAAMRRGRYDLMPRWRGTEGWLTW